jgi:3-methyladenine DNA glycosylase AlkD
MSRPLATATSLRALLRAHADPVNAAGAQRYFVGGVKTYGVRRERLDEIARGAVAALRERGGLAAALRAGNALYRSGNMDEAALAARILARFSRNLEPAHFATFDRWVGWLQDWASCDSLCGQLLGPLIRRHPELMRRVVPWTRASLRWRRRASVVCLIPLARHGERLPEIFPIADRVLGDDDDMVQKGVGWLLKEGTRRRPDAVIRYLMANRRRTSRLVLRYATELLPPAKRARVLATGR